MSDAQRCKPAAPPWCEWSWRYDAGQCCGITPCRYGRSVNGQPAAPPDLVRALVEALEGVVAGLSVDGVDLRVTNVVALHKAVSAAPELLRRAKEAGV